MRCIPEQKNKRVGLIIAALLILGGISYAIPVSVRANGGSIIAMPFDVVTFASVIAAVFVLIRYKMTSFEYSVRLRSDVPTEFGMETALAGAADISSVRPEFLDFVVSKSQGSRPGNMECVLSMGDLVLAAEISRSGRNPRSLPKKDDVRRKYADGGFVFYDYTMTLGLEEALELVFVDGNRYVGVIIEPDDLMKDYFMKKSPQTKV